MDIFTLIYPFSSLSPSLWQTARYRLKYCLKGPLNPKQPTNQSKGKFLSKLDLSEKYKQIPMKKLSQLITAFISSEGLLAFKFMPFGLVNAGATFCRMMRIVLRGLSDVANFVDDILGHSELWEGHLNMLREVFMRLREAGLRVKLSKCVLGYFQLPIFGTCCGPWSNFSRSK